MWNFFLLLLKFSMKYNIGEIYVFISFFILIDLLIDCSFRDVVFCAPKKGKKSILNHMCVDK